MEFRTTRLWLWFLIAWINPPNYKALMPGVVGTMLSYFVFVDSSKTFLELVKGSDNLKQVFVGVVESHNDLGTKHFPKIAKMQNDASLNFHSDRNKNIHGELWEKFKAALPAPLPVIFNVRNLKQGFTGIEMALFTSWTMDNYKDGVLEIKVPEEYTTHKFSQDILAYVAGWVVSCFVKTAKSLSKQKSRSINTFAFESFLLNIQEHPGKLRRRNCLVW
jgi:hypothetical protein